MTTATKTRMQGARRVEMRGLAGRTQRVAESRGYTVARTGRDVFTLRKGGHPVITGDLVTVHFSIPGAPGMGMGLMPGPENDAHIANIRKIRAAVPGRIRRIGR